MIPFPTIAQEKSSKQNPTTKRTISSWLISFIFFNESGHLFITQEILKTPMPSESYFLLQKDVHIHIQYIFFHCWTVSRDLYILSTYSSTELIPWYLEFMRQRLTMQSILAFNLQGNPSCPQTHDHPTSTFWALRSQAFLAIKDFYTSPSPPIVVLSVEISI